MNNADKPIQAMAMTVAESTSLLGYSKREDIAKHAMQALLVNMGRNGINNVEHAATRAVEAADALLAELDKKP